MIVAGIGSRKGVSPAEVIAAVEAALKHHGFAAEDLSALATTEFKKEEAAIFAAGRELGLPVVVVDGEPTSPISTTTLTHSDLSLALAGTLSVSETAALGAAGEGARLLGPRLAVGRVTCALATTGGTA